MYKYFDWIYHNTYNISNIDNIDNTYNISNIDDYKHASQIISTHLEKIIELENQIVEINK